MGHVRMPNHDVAFLEGEDPLPQAVLAPVAAAIPPAEPLGAVRRAVVLLGGVGAPGDEHAAAVPPLAVAEGVAVHDLNAAPGDFGIHVVQREPCRRRRRAGVKAVEDAKLAAGIGVVLVREEGRVPRVEDCAKEGLRANSNPIATDKGMNEGAYGPVEEEVTEGVQLPAQHLDLADVPLGNLSRAVGLGIPAEYIHDLRLHDLTQDHPAVLVIKAHVLLRGLVEGLPAVVRYFRRLRDHIWRLLMRGQPSVVQHGLRFSLFPACAPEGWLAVQSEDRPGVLPFLGFARHLQLTMTVDGQVRCVEALEPHSLPAPGQDPPMAISALRLGLHAQPALPVLQAPPGGGQEHEVARFVERPPLAGARGGCAQQQGVVNGLEVHLAAFASQDHRLAPWAASSWLLPLFEVLRHEERQKHYHKGRQARPFLRERH
mmetsp:Transcript_113567/g.331827  ORF Transcript_113567/g.331827 Transcript_113567/m.331827 type:complete len:429 (+) Transcript_113567:458-1744(+)